MASTKMSKKKLFDRFGEPLYSSVLFLIVFEPSPDNCCSISWYDYAYPEKINKYTLISMSVLRKKFDHLVA